MQVINLSEFESNTGYPFAIYWVYTPTDSFIVKGMSYYVEEWLIKNVTKGVYYYSYWRNGRSRGRWRVTGGLSLFFRRDSHSKQKRWIVETVIRDTQGKSHIKTIASFRRIPNKWIDLYDQAEMRYANTCMKEARALLDAKFSPSHPE